MLEQVIHSPVECQSGFSFCDHPTAIVWEGQHLAIKNIEAEWRDPVTKYYHILTENGARFEIQFHESEDCWSITPISIQNLYGKNNPLLCKEN